MKSLEECVAKAEEYWTFLRDSSLPIALFGAGNKGRKSLEPLRRMGVSPLQFVDNNPDLQGRDCEGLPVSDYEDLISREPSCLILVTTSTNFFKDIRDQLAGRGNSVYHFSLPFKVDEVLLECEAIREKWSQYQNLLNSLADDESRGIFLRFLYYKMSGDSSELFELESGDTFFDEQMISDSQTHHYVDVGAFTGDTILRFCQFSRGKYVRIDAFELDERNYSKILLFAKYGRVLNCHVHNIGLWHEKKEATYSTLEGAFAEGFENPNLFCDVKGKLDHEFTDRIGQEEVRVVDAATQLDTLDNLFSESNPSLIKINALGSDLSVLLGARRLVLEKGPSLILDFGSRPDHILEIPRFFEQCGRNYSIYLRQKSIFSDSKTILYAVPE